MPFFCLFGCLLTLSLNALEIDPASFCQFEIDLKQWRILLLKEETASEFEFGRHRELDENTKIKNKTLE